MHGVDAVLMFLGSSRSKGRPKLFQWVVPNVHPGFFFPAPRTKRPLARDAATGYQLPGLARTTRADVAQIMLRILTDPSTYGKKLIMASIQDNE